MPWYRKLGWPTAWGPAPHGADGGSESAGGSTDARIKYPVKSGGTGEEGDVPPGISGAPYERRCLSSAGLSLRKVVFALPVLSEADDAGDAGGCAGPEGVRGVSGEGAADESTYSWGESEEARRVGRVWGGTPGSPGPEAGCEMSDGDDDCLCWGDGEIVDWTSVAGYKDVMNVEGALALSVSDHRSMCVHLIEAAGAGDLAALKALTLAGRRLTAWDNAQAAHVACCMFRLGAHMASRLHFCIVLPLSWPVGLDVFRACRRERLAFSHLCPLA